MNKLSLFICASLWVSPGFAQSVDIRLPYYAARTYYFCLFEGTHRDTVATGELDSRGRAFIDLSARHPSYRGVGRFSVEGYGRVWNIVINGNEKVIMSEPDKQDSEPVFAGSAENAFLIEALARQSRLIREYSEAANTGRGQSLSYVLALPGQRVQAASDGYKAFRGEIADSPLYAARLVEILGCLSGMGSSFGIPQESIPEEQRQFIVNKPDYGDLYTSGFWQPAFDVWYQTCSGNDSLLLNDSRLMLDRCGGDIAVRRELTQTLIRLLSKYGKDYLLPALGTEYLTMPLNGQPAPQIAAEDSLFLPRQSLVVFYETGCGNCHYELEELKGKYKLLTDNNIRVVSIAADTDREVFEGTAAQLPWADKICDFRGFDGDNFRNYGIVGTPTYILTDSEGIVRGRYAQLKELLK